MEIQTRAIALPKATITGDYRAVQTSDVDTPPVEIPGFTFGTDQSWQTEIRLVQSLYEGGRMLSALRAAKLVRAQALLNYQVAVADTVLEVQRAVLRGAARPAANRGSAGLSGPAGPRAG